jgi:hypothetical protein
VTIDAAAPRSRRTLLAAGLGGALATVAAALGRPQAAQAADLDPILAGATTEATSATTLQQNTGSVNGLAVTIAVNGGTGTAIVAAASDGPALRAQNTSGGPTVKVTNTGAINPGAAIFAVAGSSITVPTPQNGVGIHVVQTAGGNALFAQSSGTAVAAYGDTIGLDAQGSTLGARAINGANGTALLAISGIDSVTPVAKTGVYGYANQDAAAIGVQGKSALGIGVYGKSTSNTGLRGDSSSGTAVRAFSTGGRAINATSGGTTAPGIASQTTGGTAAIQGFCGAGAVPPPEKETGVQGRCDTSADSIGVFGESNTGTAVLGASNAGSGVVGNGYYGVWGTGTSGVTGDVDLGTGVQGWTGAAFAPTPATHVGVWAGAEDGRIALQVQGVAKFNRSGLASFAAGTSSKKVTVPGGITASAFGLATLQANRAGVWVRAVVPATADSSITIYLNTTVASATNVGWQVLG